MNSQTNQSNNTPEEFIVVSEENDRNYWAQRLGVSSEVLKSAVRATRSLTLKIVTAYLNKPQSKSLA